MHHHKVTFYGSNTIGEKGQVVIPVEGRQELGLNPGDKLIFLGDKEHGVLIVSKAEVVEQHMVEFQTHFESMKNKIKEKDE